MGEITENIPAHIPMKNRPIRIVAKYFRRDTTIAIVMITLMMSKESLLPLEAIYPPVRAPIAAPRGAAVPRMELQRSLSSLSQPSWVGMRVVRKL